MAKLSKYFRNKEPSAIRLAQIDFEKRSDNTEAIDVAIGNVSLPMHQAMQERMLALDSPDSPFRKGVVRYTPSIGFEETRQAILNVIASSDLKTNGLYPQITDGGSMGMELLILGVCGPAGTGKEPLLVIDPAYTNYSAMAERTGRSTVSVLRTLQDNGEFTQPEVSLIEKAIVKHKPGAVLVITHDNPTGQLIDHQTMIVIGSLCVKHNIWMVGDEAYREIHKEGLETTSIWKLNEKEVPGITGRRISIESSSKVFNGCGLRVGALVTDNLEFHTKSVAESTANLCAPAIDQWIFGALAHVSHDQLKQWYRQQRKYYETIMSSLVAGFRKNMPDMIISQPQAAIYTVIDVRNIAKAGFNAQDFVKWCATEGKVNINGRKRTLLVSPMEGFYTLNSGSKNPGKTQMRIACVETPEIMALVPELFTKLFRQYQDKKS